jgi:hypothetical protein
MLWKCCKLLWGYDTSSCVLKSQDKPFLGYNNAFFSKLFSPWVVHILMSAPKFLTLLPSYFFNFNVSISGEWSCSGFQIFLRASEKFLRWIYRDVILHWSASCMAIIDLLAVCNKRAGWSQKKKKSRLRPTVSYVACDFITTRMSVAKAASRARKFLMLHATYFTSLGRPVERHAGTRGLHGSVARKQVGWGAE